MSDETFYPGPSRNHLAAFPPKERWDDWTELDSRAWPKRVERHYSIVPTTCFNCESACGLLAYIDKVTGEIQKFEGNPEQDRKSTRLNSSHGYISYAVFCLKKKKKIITTSK